MSDQAALLFTWSIGHTDDFGRIEGGADDVLFSIVPRRGWRKEQVEAYLKELWEVGLYKKYHDAKGKRYLEVVNFEEYQTFRSDRSRKAQCPMPDFFEDKWDTNDTQRVKKGGEVKLSQGKLSQGKGSADTQEASADTQPPKTATEVFMEAPMTPREKALRFFEGVEQLKNRQEVPWLKDFVLAIVAANKADKVAIWREIVEFTRYWTELNHTGTKQKWQLQKTFEVERRLSTWFGRAGFKGFTTAGAFAKSSKGKEIVGLDEDTENGRNN